MTDPTRELLEAQRETNRLLNEIEKHAHVVGVFTVATSFVIAILLGVTCSI